MSPEKLDVATLGLEEETAGIVDALRELAERTGSPLVRSCLESAMEDIIFLTTAGAADLAEEEDGEELAA